MAGREVMESADSMRARSLMEVWVVDEGEDGCRWGRVCRMTSVMKCKSDGELTLGITRASRLGDWSYSISARSPCLNI